MPIVYPHKTAMPCADPEERRRSWDEVAEGYTVERAIAEAQPLPELPGPRVRAGLPGQRADPRVHAPRRGGRLRGRRAHDPPPQPAAGDLRPRLPGRAPVRGAVRAASRSRTRSASAGWSASSPTGSATHGNGGESRRARGAGASRRSAIIGSGPAGLTAASDLAQLGYPVTIFEALHAFGGVLRYGIPQFRLPKEIVDEDVEHLKALGVEFVRDVIIGKTVTIDQLIDEFGYSAVFVGTGAGSPMFMNIPGENLKGVYSANEFLTRVNLMKAYSFPEYDTPVRRPRRAAVIGAGDTAMDAVRCSIRLGAEEAHIVYRRSEQEKGARAEDYERARDEGVIFDWLTAAEALPRRRERLGPRHRVHPHRARRARRVGPPPPGPGTRLGVHDGGRPRRHRARHEPEPARPADDGGLDVDSHGCIVADPATGATSREGVFAGGDIVTGAATVILAMGAGRRAATAIHEYLQRQAQTDSADNAKPMYVQEEAWDSRYFTSF